MMIQKQKVFFIYLSLVAYVLLIVGNMIQPIRAQTDTAPGQFIAKMFTEALGRAPRPDEWSTWVTNLNGACSDRPTPASPGFQALRTAGAIPYTCDEFYGLNYDPAAKLLALYRGALNREPDDPMFTYYKNYLSSSPCTSDPTCWPNLVATFFNSAEFTGLAQSRICPTTNGIPAYSYSWGGGNILDIGMGTGGDYPQAQRTLQELLNAAAAPTSTNRTVTLKQKAVVILNSQLTIPAGVRLITYGFGPEYNPSLARQSYALMARLIRGQNFNLVPPPNRPKICKQNCPQNPSPGDALIMLQPGATLDSIWVDGQFYPGSSIQQQGQDVNVALYGGGDPPNSTTLRNCRISNTAGGAQVLTYGFAAQVSCNTSPTSNTAANVITNNLLTGYANDHYPLYNAPQICYPNSLCPDASCACFSGAWADGITNYCEKANIAGNEIVDPTDVGIVAWQADFRGLPGLDGPGQLSTIQNNVILNAGNRSFAGVATESEYQSTCNDFNMFRNFSGLSVTNNTLWTGPQASMDLGLSVGARAWHGCNTVPARGTSFTNNQLGVFGPSTPKAYLRATDGIGVSGMFNAIVAGNTFNAHLFSSTRCTGGLLIADDMGNPPWASFAPPVPPHTSGPINGCLAPPPQ